MTAPPEASTTTHNTADSGAVVGIQAEVVRDSNVYMYSEGSPKEKYEAGKNYLSHGVPTKARELIGDAMVRGHDSGEVRFHWVLAMLSKRSYRELTAEEIGQLRELPKNLDHYREDEWKQGLRAICGLLDCLDNPDRDSGPVLRELLSLASEQRAQILKHLDMVLTGAIRERLWADIRAAAEADQLGNDRVDRVWAYFQPTPHPPRRTHPKPESTTPHDWLKALLWSTVFAGGMATLGWLVLDAGPSAAVAYLVTLAAAYVFARAGAEWWYRTRRFRAKENELAEVRRVNRAPDDGFADRIDRMFDHYLHRWAPGDVERQVWLHHTAGFRNALRDEIVEMYRESRVKHDRLAWLVRHMVGDLKKRWQNGTLWDYRERYRTPDSVRVWCCVGALVAGASAAVVVDATVRARPFPASLGTLAVVVGGWAAAHSWLRIVTERRRVLDEDRELARRFADQEAAYHRWTAKLDDRMPSEQEMERWLDCDKTVLIEEAMRHYRMTWRDIIAHTFLQGPAKRYKRAKITKGRWWYSRYDLRLFLITVDGVREVSTELDFERGTFAGQVRRNFRFDAVASVKVQENKGTQHDLEMELVNGPSVQIRVTDPADGESDEDAERTSELTVQSAGFAHALHIFEGIAAEGKQWVNRLRRSTTELTDSDLQERGPDDV